ncbi:unnamed protein product [Nesidiocoris tenuis]|uniref:polo kinase n=1 Tax=Nesidiocoris tenuis TaxID=355587 RepID=A0A6H5FZ14_9HEMI|nr:unnamed protein product [Nesidiocoris tenuis]
MGSKREEIAAPIPEIIYDSTNGVTYYRKRFFGKGGFAKCYELQKGSTDEIYAGKIVSKSTLKKGNQREKMAQEIEIHRSLSHYHVVQFHGYFEDPNNVYVLLELCRKRSMMELHKRRKALTEPEVRFFMKQLLEGVLYLHNLNIIHRDLKLGNLFLNDDLILKIGDFGLAAKIEYSGQRKKTVCGTPNYIAPEILNKKGHSFEVDVWSIGCIMFTLLVGKPPFETSSLRETYAKIRRCEYTIPPSVSEPAAQMVHQMLTPEPSLRPTVKQLLKSNFMINEETSDPNACPFVWISKWVDYSDKYGFGYQLCDEGVGVVFNDNTKLLLLPNHRNIHYIERDGSEQYYVHNKTPAELDKKLKLLSYFRRYMTEHLMKAGDTIRTQEADNLSRAPYLHMWQRSSSGVMLQLTNGTFQINFSTDHSKIIMCPLMQAVTYIDADKNFRTYRFNTISSCGAVPGLLENLEYAYRKISAILQVQK